MRRDETRRDETRQDKFILRRVQVKQENLAGEQILSDMNKSNGIHIEITH